jgi:hypothetical protein
MKENFLSFISSMQILSNFKQPSTSRRNSTSANYTREKSYSCPSIHLLYFTLLTYLLTYSLTHSMVKDILWKADSHSTCQTRACFLYGTQTFIAVLRKARHWTLSWASWIQFGPSIPVSIRSNLILSSHLRLGLPSGLFPSGLPNKTP